jgi:hypothetical protein
MKILSVWCPWAQLILCAGKDVENRGWMTTYRGPLVVHASKGNHTPREVAELLGRLVAERMITRALADVIAHRVPDDRGKVIGVVNLVGAKRSSTSRWWVPGQVALELADPKLFDEPIAHRGEQGMRDYRGPLPEGFA